MRRVADPDGALLRLKLIVCGALASLKRAMAKSVSLEDSTV